MNRKQNTSRPTSPGRKKRTRLYELPDNGSSDIVEDILFERADAPVAAAPPLFQETVMPDEAGPMTSNAAEMDSDSQETPPDVTADRDDSVMLRTPPLPLPEGEGLFTPSPSERGPGGEVEKSSISGKYLRKVTDSTMTDMAEAEGAAVSAEQLHDVLTRHVYAALAIGLVPLPLVDFALITGIQINLLRALTKLYGLPFTNGPVKKFIGSLAASVAPVAAAPALAASLAQTVPLVGHAAGVVTMPLLGAAATYALGKVFIQHFATGGTLLSFDPEQMRAYYVQMFAEGRQMAAAMQHANGAQAPQSHVRSVFSERMTAWVKHASRRPPQRKATP